MAEQDPIQQLFGLWRRLAVPPAQPSERDLEESEDEALAWMRAAWQRLEAPVWNDTRAPKLHAHAWSSAGTSTGGRSLDRDLTASRSLALVLAACALVLLMLAPRAFTPGDIPSNAARTPEGRGALRVAEQPLESAPAWAAFTPHSLELRSGSVRLILLEDPADFAFEEIDTSLPTAGNQKR